MEAGLERQDRWDTATNTLYILRCVKESILYGAPDFISRTFVKFVENRDTQVEIRIAIYIRSIKISNYRYPNV